MVHGTFEREILTDHTLESVCTLNPLDSTGSRQIKLKKAATTSESFEILDMKDLRHDVYLKNPWETTNLLQIRTGRVKQVFNKHTKSGIFKTQRKGPILVDHLGCEGDEHAYEMHGGVDKALMQYCSDYYPLWQKELPDKEHLFNIGAFGENLVTDTVNEYNVCIGDTVRIGVNVIVQISEPRQPCFKLNHRFQTKNMAKRTQDAVRTGWYLRVLQGGYIKDGDEMVLLERPNPKWTIAQVHRFLYEDPRNEEAMRELVTVDALGKEIKGIFTNRLKKQYESQQFRLLGKEEDHFDGWSDFLVTEKSYENPRTVSLIFEAVEPVENPAKAEPGSHARLKLGGKLIRAYSVVGGDENSFELGIAKSDNSRGGSDFIHTTLKKGDKLSISKMTSNFPLSPDADYHTFIAGGIGLTAFLEAIRTCKEKNYPYRLHYLIRNTEDLAFKRYLTDCTTVYDKSVGNACDVSKILGQVKSLGHVYCCGSERLMKDVAQKAEACGIGPERLHFEAFETDTTGDPFTAELAESHKTIQVASHQSLLDVLRETGFDIPSSCEVGNCGTCRVGLKSGRVEHRGTGLTPEEKAEELLSCVSRGIGCIVLDI